MVQSAGRSRRTIRPRVRRELVLAVALVGFGMFILPLAVYVVGQLVIGEYPADGGALALTADIWSSAIRGNPLALALVLSPYGIVQFVRLARRR